MYYHVIVELKIKSSRSEKVVIADLDIDSYDEVVDEYVIPYINDEHFYVHGTEVNKKEISYIIISHTDKSANQISTEITQSNYQQKLFFTYSDIDAVTLGQYDITKKAFRDAKQKSMHEDIPNAIISIENFLHSKISEVSSIKYNDGHYADAVESAFKEINSRLKRIYKLRTGVEKDGKDLMAQIFSDSNPILKLSSDLDSISGKSEQEGYRFIFMGSILAIRNPKAHENQTIAKEDAFDRLIFASLLMKKNDEALEFSHIKE